MIENWYDIDWKNEREELVEIEDATPITVPDEPEEEIEEEVCTCEFSESLCLLHNPPEENEED